MNKTEFLKAAREKYETAIRKEFISEMNFIYSDKLILRLSFDSSYDPNNKEGDTGFRHRWCTVETLPIQKTMKIEDALGKYLSEDEEHYPRIINALKKALKKSPNKMVDEVEFDKGTDDEVLMETITMWEPMEYTLTVQQLCDTIGIK